MACESKKSWYILKTKLHDHMIKLHDHMIKLLDYVINDTMKVTIPQNHLIYCYTKDMVTFNGTTK